MMQYIFQNVTNYCCVSFHSSFIMTQRAQIAGKNVFYYQDVLKDMLKTGVHLFIWSLHQCLVLDIHAHVINY